MVMIMVTRMVMVIVMHGCDAGNDNGGKDGDDGVIVMVTRMVMVKMV